MALKFLQLAPKVTVNGAKVKIVSIKTSIFSLAACTL